MHGFKTMGRRAYDDKKQPSDCPLQPNSRGRTAWMAGYHERRKEVEDDAC